MLQELYDSCQQDRYIVHDDGIDTTPETLATMVSKLIAIHSILEAIANAVRNRDTLAGG